MRLKYEWTSDCVYRDRWRSLPTPPAPPAPPAFLTFPPSLFLDRRRRHVRDVLIVLDALVLFDARVGRRSQSGSCCPRLRQRLRILDRGLIRDRSIGRKAIALHDMQVLAVNRRPAA